jgi:hypothetical protein
MFLVLILMVLITILYSIPPKPASTVSSACECLGRLSMNGHLMNTIGRLPQDNFDEIKTIMTQSLDDADSKMFIKPNVNSIAGWRPKQVSYSFLSIFLFDINSFFCIVELCGTQLRVDAQYFCLSICWSGLGRRSAVEAIGNIYSPIA